VSCGTESTASAVPACSERLSVPRPSGRGDGAAGSDARHSQVFWERLVSIRDAWGAIGPTARAESFWQQQQASLRIGPQHPSRLVSAAPSRPAGATLGDADSTIQSAARAIPIENRGWREGAMGGLSAIKDTIHNPFIDSKPGATEKQSRKNIIPELTRLHRRHKSLNQIDPFSR
jgi:hypothetical protein